MPLYGMSEADVNNNANNNNNQLTVYEGAEEWTKPMRAEKKNSERIYTRLETTATTTVNPEVSNVKIKMDMNAYL